jgi:hypothetical protein
MYNIRDPVFEENKFLPIPYYWGGQSDPLLYDMKFVDGLDELVCTLEITPP